MEWVDRKFAGRKRQYVLQCLLATLSVLIVLLLLERIASEAVIAALGATGFIVFAAPKAPSSRPRAVVGGYGIGTVIGVLCHWPAQLHLVGHPVLDRYVAIACAAVAVGLAVFLMTVTNTEHPPAVGIALGLVVGPWRVETVAVVLAGAAVLCLARWLLRRWLKDLV